MSRQKLIQQIIDNFGKRVIQQSRSNLTKNKKNATSSLYRSLDFKSNVKGSKFEGQFFMEDYGMFVDARCQGKDILCQSPEKSI
jgi:hypothetical protein